MFKNSNEKLDVAEAEAFQKGTKNLDDPENNGRTDMLWGALYSTKLKGRQFHNTKVTMQFKTMIGSLSPTEDDASLSSLTSLSMSYIIVPMATSSAFHLLLPNSDPAGKFLPLLALSHNWLHWKAA